MSISEFYKLNRCIFLHQFIGYKLVVHSLNCGRFLHVHVGNNRDGGSDLVTHIYLLFQAEELGFGRDGKFGLSYSILQIQGIG